MRIAPVLLSAVVLGGCTYTWELQDDIQSGCSVPVPFFFDGDGDGWGEPGSEPIEACFGDSESGFVARNDRDCWDDEADDAARKITGRIGSVCPDRLVAVDTAAGEVVEYVGATSGTSEFVLVEGATPTVWPAAAEDACGPWGWGGALATFSSTSDLAAVQEVVGSDPFAGFVGLVQGASGWEWPEGDGVDPETVGWCDPVEAVADFPYEDSDYLALILVDGEWCFGLPGDADDGSETSTYLADWADYGHFVCEREAPDPTDFQTPALTE